MNPLQSLKARELLFVSANDRNKFRSILSSICDLKSIALAHNSAEPVGYRNAAKELFQYVEGLQSTLICDDFFTKPLIYIHVIYQLTVVIGLVSVSQPESIFRMLNKMLVIKKETELLYEKLKS